MTSTKYGATTASIKIVGLALLIVGASACSARTGGSSAFDVDPVPECEAYAAAFADCDARLGIAQPTTDAHVASMKRAFDARSVDPTERADLRQSCIAALDRLRSSCRAPQAPSPTASK